MVVFVAQVSRVYPLEASVIMSYTSKHVLSASVNKQNKTKQNQDQEVTNWINRRIVEINLPWNQTLKYFQQQNMSKHFVFKFLPTIGFARPSDA